MKREKQSQNRREEINEVLNFEKTAQKAIQERRNFFEYNNHFYFFKKDNNGNVYICSDGRFIAYVFIKKEKCLIRILREEKEYVTNTQTPLPFSIKYSQANNVER